MRQSEVSVTRASYINRVPENSLTAMGKLEAELRKPIAKIVNGKYYESITAFEPTGIERHFCLSQTPDFEHEMTDPYVIERIKAAFLKEQNQ